MAKIMVIDDDRTHLDMAGAMLGRCYDVTPAASGAGALEMLCSGEAPDLILLDIDMPDMDGFETFERIRDMPAYAEIPVIFLTGMTGSETELAGLRLGAQDYITKPFVRDNLLARIRLRLESSRQAVQLRDMRERMRHTDREDERFAVLTRVLSPAEQEVAQLILKGCSNQEIAAALNYSPGYVKNLATSVYGKLGVHGRAELRGLFRG